MWAMSSKRESKQPHWKRKLNRIKRNCWDRARWPDSIFENLVNQLKRPNQSTVIAIKSNELYSGSMSSSYGGWVGVPANYFYKSATDIDKNKLYINNQPINWDENSGQLLQDSLVLTESEQAFAFCRSILELKSYRVILNTLISTGSVIATYALGMFVNEKYKMFKRPCYVSVMKLNRSECRVLWINLFNYRSGMRPIQWYVWSATGSLDVSATSIHFKEKN